MQDDSDEEEDADAQSRLTDEALKEGQGIAAKVAIPVDDQQEKP